MNAPTISRSSLAGFSLVEVTVAVGIVGFCLLAIFGLVPIGITATQNSIEANAAASVAARVAADLRGAPLTSGTSSMGFNFSASPSPQTVYFAESCDATGAMGIGPVLSGTNFSRYRASVAFTPPSTTKGAAMVRILVTWPALADKEPTSWPKNYSGSLEVLTAINRN